MAPTVDDDRGRQDGPIPPAAADAPFRDRQLPVERRVEDLLARLSVEDKAGLMFHTMAGPGGVPGAAGPGGPGSVEHMITAQRINHFNVFGAAPPAREFVAWHNHVQRLAAGVGVGIPITFSSDPRHAFTHNPGTAVDGGSFSRWPESLGLAAIGDTDLVRTFADIARQEYLAVGIRVALHPQIDLATEPRWSRINGTFGEDAELTSRLVEAYIYGFQTNELGPDSVATMVKHFPGGGPQRDGEDPHFDYGREQIYPTGRFDYHLQPFRAAIAAGCSQMMPYYGMPVGTDYEEVGFGFNRGVITDLLRTELGFDGIVCTDWGLLTDAEIMGQPMPARAWGVESLSRPERVLKALDAGVDQFGGENCPEVIVELVRSGMVDQTRLDTSVRRLLAEKFRLGLFDAPYLDPDHAERTVGRADFRAAGEAAQRAAMTLLSNGSDDHPVLPLQPGIRLYIEGVDQAAAAEFATVVDDPADADMALLRIGSPYEPRSGGFESFFHAGSLAFDEIETERLLAVCRAVPTVINIYLERPAVIGELISQAAAVIADFGAADRAALEVVFGESAPQGRLPFDLPSSMVAVITSDSDAPFDTADPVRRFGDGLSYR